MARLKEKLLGGAKETGGSRSVRDIIDSYNCDPSRVIAVMQDVQAVFGYLPEEELMFIAGELCIPLSMIYGIATFYKSFRLLPRGRHQIRLCTGTACHVRGAEDIREAIERELGVEVGQTTGDMRFSFETVRCIGCCGLAPVAMVDEDVHGKLDLDLKKVLEKYE